MLLTTSTVGYPNDSCLFRSLCTRLNASHMLMLNRQRYVHLSVDKCAGVQLPGFLGANSKLGLACSWRWSRQTRLSGPSK